MSGNLFWALVQQTLVIDCSGADVCVASRVFISADWRREAFHQPPHTLSVTLITYSQKLNSLAVLKLKLCPENAIRSP